MTFESLMVGNGYGEIYLSDVTRFFGIDVDKARLLKSKLEEVFMSKPKGRKGQSWKQMKGMK